MERDLFDIFLDLPWPRRTLPVRTAAHKPRSGLVARAIRNPGATNDAKATGVNRGKRLKAIGTNLTE
jgi:hypothetical protein